MEVWQVTSVMPPGRYRFQDRRRVAIAATWCPSEGREGATLSQPDTQNQIDHIAYVVDASSSMQERAEETITVIDNQTAFLAEMSQQTGRETRVTIYIFSDPHRIRCVVFDKDVLRLPSIREFYKPDGWTALLDATGLAIEDLKMTMKKYGDHAFLLFAFTDGQENRSQRHSAFSLSTVIKTLDGTWTVAALVPDVNGKLMARRYGFPDGNISIWNVNSSTGVEEAGETMKAALSNYSGLRSSGGTGTRNLFSTDPSAVNKATIQAAGLKPLDPKRYLLIPVTKPVEAQGAVFNKDNKLVWEIATFVRNNNGGTYRLGSAYYLLDKQEKIGGNKELAVLEVATSKVFVGDGVRAMIGLSDKDQRVAPNFNPDYKIFVQSQSPNRHLKSGDKLLVLK